VNLIHYFRTNEENPAILIVTETDDASTYGALVENLPIWDHARPSLISRKTIRLPEKTPMTLVPTADLQAAIEALKATGNDEIAARLEAELS
jgi:hypothetical protein